MAEILVLNRWNAERYSRPNPVISFNEYTDNPMENRYPLHDGILDVQRIFCDDVEDEIDSSYRLFDYIDAVKIIDYLDKYRGKDVMVHCAAGVSRSPACAKWMVDYLGYTLAEFNGLPGQCFVAHNTHVYYILKRAMLDHQTKIDRIKEANRVKTE